MAKDERETIVKSRSTGHTYVVSLCCAYQSGMVHYQLRSIDRNYVVVGVLADELATEFEEITGE